MTALWQSIHIYYYDANKDNLLLNCVRPLFLTLRERGWVERLYFIRHWRGGSHVRLQLYADASLFQEKIVPYVRGEVEAYFQQVPSTASFSEEEARRQYERRKLQIAKHQYRELRPNNSLEVAPYEDLSATVGSEGVARLLEHYYEETGDLAFNLIEQTRNNYTARLNVCFDQLVAVVATSPFLSLDRAYMSYRSHAEGYIAGESLIEEPGRRRQRLEQAYRERHDSVNKRVRHLLTLITKAPERLPSELKSIIEIHRRYGEQAFHGAQEGVMRLKTHEDAAEDRKKMKVEESAYLAAVFNNPAVLAYSNDPVVVAHRIELNFLYLHLHRIGMLNEDRYILDYYIANAIEELLGIDPVVAMSA
ncbi:MAG TPA: lantibiotic dehydratase C-terminal domain-containing protein [Ktedonobacteraceae bacterium]|nr:lantibiotic dehydratase C-terminal domain-containing protein [Ktedonobacteraceae bacterium]